MIGYHMVVTTETVAPTVNPTMILQSCSLWSGPVPTLNELSQLITTCTNPEPFQLTCCIIIMAGQVLPTLSCTTVFQSMIAACTNFLQSQYFKHPTVSYVNRWTILRRMADESESRCPSSLPLERMWIPSGTSAFKISCKKGSPIFHVFVSLYVR